MRIAGLGTLERSTSVVTRTDDTTKGVTHDRRCLPHHRGVLLLLAAAFTYLTASEVLILTERVRGLAGVIMTSIGTIAIGVRLGQR